MTTGIENRPMQSNSGTDTSHLDKRSRPTRVRYQVLAVGCSFALLTYIERLGFVRATTEIKVDLNLTKAQIGDLASVFLIAYGLFQIPCGSLGDRLGAKRLLIVLVVGWSIMTLLTPLAGWTPILSPFLFLIVIRFLFGALQSGAFPVWSRVMTDWMTIDERARSQGIVWMFSRLGGAVGPYLFFRLSILFGNWSMPLICLGLLGLIWSGGFWVWFQNRPEQMPSVNVQEQELILAGRDDGGTSAERIPLSALLSSLNVWALCLVYSFTGFSGNFITNLLPIYLQDDRHLSGEVTTLLASLPLMFGIAGCVVGGFLSDLISRRFGSRKWGRRICPMIGLTAAGLALMVVPRVDSIWALALLLAGSFFFNDLNIAPIWAACADSCEKHAGTISGAMNMCGQFTGAIGMSFAGRMLDQEQSRFLFMIFGGSYLMAALCWLAVDVTRPLRIPNSGRLEIRGEPSKAG